MKIFFEDGELMKCVQEDIGATHRVDAKYGFKQNQQALDTYNEYYKDAPVAIYTNSLVALSNEYCWNKDLKIPELYIRPGVGRAFVRIDLLTNRELREAYNLRRMYMANAFGNL